MKNVTIIELAKRAGVSIKTVSRVMNGEPNVKATTRDKVKKIAKELNYTPNMSARSLASKKSYVIAHFQDNPNPDYLAKLYLGIHKVCRAARYYTVQEPITKPYAPNVMQYLDEFKVDGVILSPPLCDDMELLDILKARKIPFVRISPRTPSSVSSACLIDDKQAASRVTKLLIDFGHKKIAHFTGPAEHKVSALRQEGFEAAIKDAGLDLASCPVVKGDFTVRSGTELCENLLKTDAAVTAIFAANDDMAVGAMVGAQKCGLTVPKDISIVGFDGSRIGDVIWPALTTMRQPVQNMAEKAAEILLLEINMGVSERSYVEFEPELIIRGTTSSL